MSKRYKARRRERRLIATGRLAYLVIKGHNGRQTVLKNATVTFNNINLGEVRHLGTIEMIIPQPQIIQ